jgi:hypothetical protein
LQSGSYFGATLCAVDLDGDDIDDVLLVGAPLETIIEQDHVTVDAGSVHVYQSEMDHDMVRTNGMIFNAT